MGGKELREVGDADFSCLWDPISATPIMLYGGVDVPAVEGIWCPCDAVLGVYIDQHLGARGADWCAIVVELAL